LSKITVSLPTGKLNLNVSSSDFQLDDLTEYAARQNPKRGFLFVSKLLAKYWPSEPQAMLAMHQYLAQALSDKVQGTSVFIGMAEAAAGLGQGVYETYLQQQPATQDDTLFLHSSRYFLKDSHYLDFQEQHSHASQFYVYVPPENPLKSLFLHAQTLVLIDDEVTTGTTFVNLITAYQKVNPELQRVLIVSILNFVDVARQREIQELVGCELLFINALAAEIDFQKQMDYRYTDIPNVKSSIACKREKLSLSGGRLGIQGELAWDESILQSLMQHWRAGQRVLLLGTGEFMHLAFLIALSLDKQGWNVRVQSTARSPLLKGEAIQEKLEFIDNYADNIPNYLYNVRVGQYDQVVICHETPLCAALTKTAQHLNAQLLYYVDGKISLS